MISDTEKVLRNNRMDNPWYHCAVRTAVVCGIFSLIVLAFFVVSYIQWRAIDAEWEVQSLELKKEFGQNPDDQELSAKIRRLDLKFRQQRMRRLEFSRRGGYLILGGVVIMLIAVRSADTFRKKLPSPQVSSGQDNEQIRQAKFARWSVTAGLAILGSGALILAMNTDVDFGSTDGIIRTSYPSFEQYCQNWPAFRGPEGLGVVHDTNIPDSWNGKRSHKQSSILWG